MPPFFPDQAVGGEVGKDIFHRVGDCAQFTGDLTGGEAGAAQKDPEDRPPGFPPGPVGFPPGPVGFPPGPQAPKVEPPGFPPGPESPDEDEDDKGGGDE